MMRSVFFLLNLEDLKMLLLIETLIYFDVRLYFFYQMFEHFFLISFTNINVLFTKLLGSIFFLYQQNVCFLYKLESSHRSNTE